MDRIIEAFVKSPVRFKFYFHLLFDLTFFVVIWAALIYCAQHKVFLPAAVMVSMFTMLGVNRAADLIAGHFYKKLKLKMLSHASKHIEELYQKASAAGNIESVKSLTGKREQARELFNKVAQNARSRNG
jgi:hypothetical protein